MFYFSTNDIDGLNQLYDNLIFCTKRCSYVTVFDLQKQKINICEKKYWGKDHHNNENNNVILYV